MTILYRGTCQTCRTLHQSEWQAAWVGPFDEDFYGLDCRHCGPGHQVLMDPDDETEADLRRAA